MENIIRITVLVFSLFIANGCSAENMRKFNVNHIEAEVLDSFQGLVEASKSLDANRYFQYFDKEKFTGLNSDGRVWLSMERLEKMIRPGFSQIDKIVALEFSNVKVTVINPTTAILVNEYRETILLKNGTIVKQSGGGAQVWSKSGNAWKLVSFSASEAPISAAPA